MSLRIRIGGRVAMGWVLVAVAAGVGVRAGVARAAEDEGGSGGGKGIFDDTTEPRPAETPPKTPPNSNPRPTPRPPATRPAPPRPKPLTIPGKAQQAAALELVKQVYAEGLAKKAPAERAAVARQMLVQAGRSTEPAERYVLLTQARDVGASCADVGIVMESVRALATSFTPVDEAAMTSDAMVVAAKATTEPGRCAAIAGALLGASEQALRRGSLDTAVVAAGRAEGPAKRSQDTGLSARVAARKKELAAVQAQFAGLAAARTKLANDPNDPAGNSLVGRFSCLVMGDWPTGVKHLAKGSDAALRAAAELELNNAPGGEPKAATGDAWYDVAEGQTAALLKAKATERARFWYAKALPELTGLKRVRVEKRLEELTRPAPAPPTAVAGNGKTSSGKPANGDTKPAPPAATASSDDDVAPPAKGDVAALKFVEGLIKSLPPNARPKLGTDTAQMATYLGSANGRYKIDAVLKVVSAQVRGGGGTYVSMSFEEIGPVVVGGVKYTLSLRIFSENNQARAAAGQLGPGAEVRVRGSLQEYSLTPGDGSVQISAYMEAVQFAPGKMRKPK